MKILGTFINLLLGIGVANAATTAIIDFGIYASGNPYGNQISGSSNNVTIGLLATDAATATGWNLNVTGLRADGGSSLAYGGSLWNAGTGVNETAFNDFSSSLGLPGKLDASAWRDQASLGKNGVNTTFTLSNLVAGQEYVISFGLGRVAGGGTTNITIASGTLAPDGNNWFSNSTALQGDTALTSLDFSTNQREYIATYKITADAEGKIAVDFSPVDYGAIAFMTVTQTVPEPAVATLGMIGLLGLASRRRRI